MRRSFLSILAVTLALTAAPSIGQAADDAPTTAALSSPKKRIDDLFASLKRERDDTKATDIANRIRLEWTDSGSASVNLLMQWAEKAVAEKRNGAALDLFDQIVALDPAYVEGWNRRATLHFQMGNYRKSMSDINRVLALEPRHFGALAGMAAILSGAGKDELALRAWEQFLAVYPSERNAQKQVGDLEEKLAGSRT